MMIQGKKVLEPRLPSIDLSTIFPADSALPGEGLGTACSQRPLIRKERERHAQPGDKREKQVCGCLPSDLSATYCASSRRQAPAQVHTPSSLTFTGVCEWSPIIPILWMKGWRSMKGYIYFLQVTLLVSFGDAA